MSEDNDYSRIDRRNGDRRKGGRRKSDSKLFAVALFLHHNFVALALIGILGFSVGTYFGARHKVLNVYDQLQTNIEKLIYMDEVAYVFCAESKNKFSPQNEYLRSIEMFKYRQKMAMQFEEISSNMRSIGRLLSKEAYMKIKAFLCWNNAVMSSTKGMCSSQLLMKNPRAMDAWRNQIVSTLQQEKENHLKFMNSIRDYFVFSFTSVEGESYKPPRCDYKGNYQDVGKSDQSLWGGKAN